MTTGCGDLWEPGKRRVKRLIHDFQLRLSNEQYPEGLKMCTADAIWQREDGKEGPIRYFFEDLKKFDRKRAFYIIPLKDKEVSEDKLVFICDMRQQTQEGIVDVGNYMWQVQMVWVRTGGREWKIEKIRDMTPRKREISK